MIPLDKDPGAFRTIGELSDELGVAQHILRYWETKFPQLKPLQRAGNRRYYRPADVALARRIHHLLSSEGYTIRGVQKLLAVRGKGPSPETDTSAAVRVPSPAETPPDRPNVAASAVDFERLMALRDRLLAALAE